MTGTPPRREDAPRNPCARSVIRRISSGVIVTSAAGASMLQIVTGGYDISGRTRAREAAGEERMPLAGEGEPEPFGINILLEGRDALVPVVEDVRRQSHDAADDDDPAAGPE